jgi:hypothetical protein
MVARFQTIHCLPGGRCQVKKPDAFGFPHLHPWRAAPGRVVDFVEAPRTQWEEAPDVL